MGDCMFRMFTYKNLGFLAAIICSFSFLISYFNYISPSIVASSSAGVRLPVIMYHHICNRESSWGDYVIPAYLLEEDFKYFKENNITPVSFKMIKAFIENGVELPEKPVILTFDDGQKSFLTKAVPLLEKYGFYANINIVGSLVELYTQNGDTNDSYAYLNKADIKLLSENDLIEIGCHTYNFHSLTGRKGIRRLPTESEEQYKEIIEADLKNFNELLFSITGKSTEIYAYPYGIRSDTALNIIKSRGYNVTLTCREAVNYINRDSQMYELGRFNRPYGISSENFFEKIFNDNG